MEKLTFKQYIETKQKLREAIERTPKQTVSYSMTKYCKMIVGESKDEKVYIPLKPKNKITVDYLYINEDAPVITGVHVEDVEEVDPEFTYSVFWENERFIRWLEKNAKQIDGQ